MLEEEDDYKLRGGVAVTVAIFMFGTQSIFVKSPNIRRAGVDPFLVCQLFSTWIGLIGSVFCLRTILLASSDPSLAPYAWWVESSFGASLVMAPGHVLLLWAARRIGVGLAGGISPACASSVSFLAACFILREPLSDPRRQCSAILLIITGACIMSATKLPAIKSWATTISQKGLLCGKRTTAPKEEEESALAVELRGLIPTTTPTKANGGDHGATWPHPPRGSNTRQIPWSLTEKTTIAEGSPPRKRGASVLPLVEQENGGGSRNLKDRFETWCVADDRTSASEFLVPAGTRAYFIPSFDLLPTLKNRLRSVSAHARLSSISRLRSNSSGASIEELEQASIEELEQGMDRYATESLSGVDIFGLLVAMAGGVFLGLQGLFWNPAVKTTPYELGFFFVSQFVVTSCLLGPYFCWKGPQSLIMDHVKLCLVPTFAGGVVFCFGLTGQVVAVKCLTSGVGMPLSQLNLIVSGCWGIFYYHEIESSVLIAIFFGGAFLTLTGGIML